jgi:hypothetical protein
VLLQLLVFWLVQLLHLLLLVLLAHLLELNLFH